MHAKDVMPRRLLPPFLLSALLATTAHAGVVHGRVPAGRGLVVWMEQIPERAERKLTGESFRWFWESKPELPRSPVVAMRSGGWQPALAVLAAGDSVTFTNDDGVWHGAFCVTPGREFDLGKRAPGTRVARRIRRPGVLQVRCDIHPDESATLVVVPHHAYATADARGRWQLPDLPKGRYLLRARTRDGREARRVVQVPGGGALEVALPF